MDLIKSNMKKNFYFREQIDLCQFMSNDAYYAFLRDFKIIIECC